ncbi:glycosyltransferase, partial [Bacillus wiedmannii]
SIDMDRVLDKAAKYGLEIFDRNYEKNKKGLMPNHRFPERFDPYIKGSLKYYEIDKAYKGYKVMINVNTVKQSPTMFSRRVFEGLACGTPVVST